MVVLTFSLTDFRSISCLQSSHGFFVRLQFRCCFVRILVSWCGRFWWQLAWQSLNEIVLRRTYNPVFRLSLFCVLAFLCAFWGTSFRQNLNFEVLFNGECCCICSSFWIRLNRLLFFDFSCPRSFSPSSLLYSSVISHLTSDSQFARHFFWCLLLPEFICCCFFLFAAVPYVVFLLESLLSVSSISTLISIILTKPHWIFCWIILNSSSICCDGVTFRYCDRCTVCIASSMLPSRLPKLSLRLHRVLFCEHYRDLILPASLFV